MKELDLSQNVESMGLLCVAGCGGGCIAMCAAVCVHPTMHALL